MGTPEESYIQTSAQEKLALMKNQLVANYQEDSAIGRNLKGLRRKDFAQEVQPFHSQVELTAARSIKFGTPQAWGKMGSSRKGQMGGNIKKPGPQSSKGPSTTIDYSGSTTLLSPSATWTTEGLMKMPGQTDPTDVEAKRTATRFQANYSGLRGGGVMNSGGSMLHDKYKEKKKKDGPRDAVSFDFSKFLLRGGSGKEEEE